MAEPRKRSRIHGKIEELPREIRLVVDGMLADTRYTYQNISDYLSEQGHNISQMAVFRYAQRSNGVAQRIMEAQEQTKALVEMIKQNPNVDYTEGALQMLASGLTQKMAAAGEEIDNMPIDKAANVLISLSRTKSYKDKVYTELSKKKQLALDEFQSRIFNEIQDNDPLLAERLCAFAREFSDKITI